jgi:hypothetical protein
MDDLRQCDGSCRPPNRATRRHRAHGRGVCDVSVSPFVHLSYWVEGGASAVSPMPHAEMRFIAGVHSESCELRGAHQLLSSW